MKKLMGLMWWVDRWRKSTAYTDMTLEEQGAYRNLLDEGCLRGGPLPNDERVLAKACGDALAWKRVRATVMARFELKADGWHNETLDEVLRASLARAEKQQRYRRRKGHDDGNEGGNGQGNDTDTATGHKPGHKPGNNRGSPDPDPDRELSTEQESSRRAGVRRFAGVRLRVSDAQHRVVVSELGADAEAVDWDACYPAWDAELVESGKPFDTLVFVKARARELRESWRRSGACLRVDDGWFEECQAAHGGKCGGRFNHATQKVLDAGRAEREREGCDALASHH